MSPRSLIKNKGRIMSPTVRYVLGDELNKYQREGVRRYGAKLKLLWEGGSFCSLDIFVYF